MTTGTRRLPRPGRRTILLLVAAVALIAFILYDLNSTVRIVWYQVMNERTIVGRGLPDLGYPSSCAARCRP